MSAWLCLLFRKELLKIMDCSLRFSYTRRREVSFDVVVVRILLGCCMFKTMVLMVLDKVQMKKKVIDCK